MEQQVDNTEKQLFKQTFNNIKNKDSVNYGEILVSMSFIRDGLTSSKCDRSNAHNYTSFAIAFATNSKKEDKQYCEDVLYNLFIDVLNNENTSEQTIDIMMRQLIQNVYPLHGVQTFSISFEKEIFDEIFNKALQHKNINKNIKEYLKTFLRNTKSNYYGTIYEKLNYVYSEIENIYSLKALNLD